MSHIKSLLLIVVLIQGCSAVFAKDFVESDISKLHRWGLSLNTPNMNSQLSLDAHLNYEFLANYQDHDDEWKQRSYRGGNHYINFNLGLGFYAIFAENFGKLYDTSVPITFGLGGQLTLRNGVVVLTNLNYLWENGVTNDPFLGLVETKWKQLILDFQGGYQFYVDRKRELYLSATGGPLIVFVTEELDLVSLAGGSSTSRTTAGLILSFGAGRKMGEVISLDSHLSLLYATVDSDFGTNVNVGGVMYSVRISFNFPIRQR